MDYQFIFPFLLFLNRINNPFPWSNRWHAYCLQNQFPSLQMLRKLGTCVRSFSRHTVCPYQSPRPIPWNPIPKSCRIESSPSKSRQALSPLISSWYPSHPSMMFCTIKILDVRCGTTPKSQYRKNWSHHWLPVNPKCQFYHLMRPLLPYLLFLQPLSSTSVPKSHSAMNSCLKKLARSQCGISCHSWEVCL